MRTLTILWQRLVDASGRTCPRCSTTQQQVERAVERLTVALAPLGVEPRLEMREIAPQEFQSQPLESNRIWIAGEPLEAWLNGTPGASRCCDACGDAECRTLEVEEQTYEAIPADLMVRAGLIAASRLLAAAPSSCAPGCC
ncbi:MAG: DUF2703 domain-containing protein [Thauera sp.]|nr:DUF2703 domain-containing protein [Thauera sp.]